MRHERDLHTPEPRPGRAPRARGRAWLRSPLPIAAVGFALVAVLIAVADGSWLRADPPVVQAAAVQTATASVAAADPAPLAQAPTTAAPDTAPAPRTEDAARPPGTDWEALRAFLALRIEASAQRAAAIAEAEAEAAAPPAPPAPPASTPAPVATPAPTPVAPTPVATPAPASAAPAPAATPAPAPASTVASSALSVRERGLLDAMNRARSSVGLSQLVFSTPLLPIARERSNDLSTNDYFSHFSPTGESVYTLVADAGLRFSAIGENLARVGGDEQRSVSVAIEKLMQSPPHRANILNTAFTHVAVGAVTDAEGVTVFTSVFSGG
jgi:uncharacterized protein YkwD